MSAQQYFTLGMIVIIALCVVGIVIEWSVKRSRSFKARRAFIEAQPQPDSRSSLQQFDNIMRPTWRRR
jgi:hypothetical protein